MFIRLKYQRGYFLYVAWILLCKLCKFGEKIYYNSEDIKFFLGDYFFWRALYSAKVDVLKIVFCNFFGVTHKKC